MKNLLIVLAIFCALTANAQTYLISFTGTGASTTINSVKVENMTAGTSLTLNGSDILRLNVITGISMIEERQSAEMKIYPNPTSGKAILQISPPIAGEAIISILDMAGKLVFKIPGYLENYPQEFRLSGLKSGFYLITVKGNNYLYSGKLLCNSKEMGTIRFEKISNIQALDRKAVKMDTKGKLSTVDMNYTTGDRLKFTGVSGDYSTVKISIPTQNEAILFNFIPCADGTNNKYSIIEIGTQVWMAQNLSATKYNDGSAIPLVTDDNVWEVLSTAAYCWLMNDEATYKDYYGALYNWYAVGTGKLCPTGWHVPASDEYTVLRFYLEDNGYGIGDGNYIGKSLAAASVWYPYTGDYVPGNNQAFNNSSGFTAYPAGKHPLRGFVLWGWETSFWTTTAFTNDAIDWFIDTGLPNFYFEQTDKRYGMSVRCVKDN